MARDNISKFNAENGHGPGRKKGTVNKVTQRIRDAFATLLEGKMDDLEQMIDRVAEKDPKGAVELIIKISERFVPKLTQTQITAADGEDLKVEFTFGKKTEETETNNEFDIEDITN